MLFAVMHLCVAERTRLARAHPFGRLLSKEFQYYYGTSPKSLMAEKVDLETTPEDAIPCTNSFQDCPLAFRVTSPKYNKTR